MARDERLICASAALPEGGTGVRFVLKSEGGEEKGFAVRYGARVCAFVNRCPHMGTELDWQPGEFFEESGLYLVCSTHGAIFEPGTGFCVAGPCHGASLEPLQVRESDGQVLLQDDEPPPTKTRTPSAP
jgi:nitrite reductase/ring-hydroxylating ferredoxin subunit